MVDRFAQRGQSASKPETGWQQRRQRRSAVREDLAFDLGGLIKRNMILVPFAYAALGAATDWYGVRLYATRNLRMASLEMRCLVPTRMVGIRFSLISE